jgi:FMN phosphatase YigB (HAD superfamily)
LFVGDDRRWDVAGARQAGMRPVLICPDGADEAECLVIRELDELVTLIDAMR